ncbi:MAG: CHAP domain-containing protein [Candidatus Nomurabacteria bacterium]|jgi:surface antigen|nr:CHAP domain-containing protein [Candidatus Nomurabacteria bacterium]
MGRKTLKKSRKIAWAAGATVGVMAFGLTFLVQQPAQADYYVYWYECSSKACKEAEQKADAAREQAEDAEQVKNKYQQDVDRKTNEIYAIQADINKNQAEIEDLNLKIDNNEKKLDQLRESIKKTVVKLYLETGVSELEIIASSDSVVDFTTRQTNQQIIQDKVKMIVEETKKAKAELEAQHKLAKAKKTDNEARKADVDARRSELQDLKDEWAGKQYKYENEAEAHDEERQRQMTEQSRLVRQTFGGGTSSQCGGGYPYCDYTLDGGIDPWGLYYRECVSYTAYKVDATYGNMPYFGGRGNANEWVSTAQSYGIPTGSTAKVGSVGVSYAGYYGHVVWVEKVEGNTVYFSDYNRAGPGMYGTGSASASSFDYIYFGEW